MDLQRIDETQDLNCLRCKHCQLLPHTDMSNALDPNAIIPIHCAKTGRNRPARIHEACPIADKEFCYGKRARGKWSRGESGKRVYEGDRLYKVGPAEQLFLLSHYSNTPLDVLSRLLQRSQKAVVRHANLRGLKREVTPETLKAHGQRIRKTMCAKGYGLSADQSDYVLARHKSGDWPIGGGFQDPTHPYRAKQNAIKADILAQVASMGTAFSWHSITCHIWRHSPSGAKSEVKRRRNMKLRAQEAKDAA